MNAAGLDFVHLQEVKREAFKRDLESFRVLEFYEPSDVHDLVFPAEKFDFIHLVVVQRFGAGEEIHVKLVFPRNKFRLLLTNMGCDVKQ